MCDLRVKRYREINIKSILKSNSKSNIKSTILQLKI